VKGCLVLGILLSLLANCSTLSRANRHNVPQFSYTDSLRTHKTINCSSLLPEDCMACALQGESANQPEAGIYAVGMTIMTRAKGELKKVCPVTTARGQFEGMKKNKKMKISKKVWGVTQHILESKETGWTHFWAPRTQRRLKRNKPRWANEFEKRQCQNEEIGDHVFYNDQKCSISKKIHVQAQN